MNPIPITSSIVLKARAYKEGWIPSSISEGWYAINPLIFVSGGTFHNGTSNVTLSSFFIEKYEVTQASYQAVMGTNPSYFSVNPNRPVERVSWLNAIEYCNRRSMHEGLTPCYSYGSYGTNPDNWPTGWNTGWQNHTNVSCNWSANGYRLPTEMEWMFAAKGGNQSQGYTYSGSNTIGNVAWYEANSSQRTWDVGLKAPNELGTFDMSGNVWEWCWDIYDDYPSGNQTNPTGPVSGSIRVSRGGSWYNYASACTVSIRLGPDATYTYYTIGFRVIRVSP
ncbi:MAG: formylglycine-generating enzyme family protein [Candidatus Cloacimonetes bacterium]|nr:formylglycine-generating enzyme family protein [Candidatus Cloacimonadota bacterium]